MDREAAEVRAQHPHERVIIHFERCPSTPKVAAVPQPTWEASDPSVEAWCLRRTLPDGTCEERVREITY